MAALLSWRAQRQITPVILLVLALAGIGFRYGRRFLPETSCFDNKRNQKEIGVDCGGPCRPCEVKNPRPLTIFWARSMRSSADSYDAVAFVENPNEVLSSAKVSYEFTLLDQFGVIARRLGATFIYPHERFYIIEPAISTSREAIRVEFSIAGIDWQLRSAEPPPLVVERRTHTVEEEDGRKHSVVEAQIFNSSVLSFRQIETDFVVFDEAGNVIGANRVASDNLSAGGRSSVKSIWPLPFIGPIGRIEVRPRVNIFDPALIHKPQ